jgi:hypothetical protein
VLSLQESFSGCSLKKPGNLKCFGFLCMLDQMGYINDWFTLKTLSYITR